MVLNITTGPIIQYIKFFFYPLHISYILETKVLLSVMQRKESELLKSL